MKSALTKLRGRSLQKDLHITQCIQPISATRERPLREHQNQSGNPSYYKAVIEANESGRPAVEKLEPFTEDYW